MLRSRKSHCFPSQAVGYGGFYQRGGVVLPLLPWRRATGDSGSRNTRPAHVKWHTLTHADTRTSSRTNSSTQGHTYTHRQVVLTHTVRGLMVHSVHASLRMPYSTLAYMFCNALEMYVRVQERDRCSDEDGEFIVTVWCVLSYFLSCILTFSFFQKKSTASID